MRRTSISEGIKQGGKFVIRRAGVEPTTPGFGGLYSIQLSYRRVHFTSYSFTILVQGSPVFNWRMPLLHRKMRLIGD
jgi:hypothetical protein